MPIIHARVPPFLQSIEDPRAAQGGSLKGCPVCGGTRFTCRADQPVHTNSHSQALATASLIVPNSKIHSADKWLLCGPLRTGGHIENRLRGVATGCNALFLLKTMVLLQRL